MSNRTSLQRLLIRYINPLAFAFLMSCYIALSSAIPTHSLPLTQINANPNLIALAMRSEVTDPNTIRSIIHQARDAWVQGDADAFTQLFTADGEFIVPGNRYTGLAAIRQAVSDFTSLSLEISIEIKRILIDGEQAAVEWDWEDADPKTGQRNRADDVVMVDFVAGKISRWREYIDSQSDAAIQ
jgi:uncharacterized protein (TIGR02246 family)